MDLRDVDFRKAAASLAAERAAKTSHPEVQELVAYHACDLDDARTEEIQTHLVACRECGDLLLELERVEREERRPWTLLLEGLARATDPLRARGSWARGPMYAAVAAAVLLVPAVFLIQDAMRGGEGLPLGAYAMELHGDIKAMRGSGEPEEGEPFQFAPGMTFDLTLFPVEPVQGALEVAAFLSSEGLTKRWTVPIEVSDEGAVRIAGRVGTDIVLPPGVSVVLVAIGRPGEIPGGDALQQRLAATSVVQERDWSAWLLRVSLVAESDLP